MYRSSPFRSTSNRDYITGLDMCKVCTEAVHSVALWRRVTLQAWSSPCRPARCQSRAMLRLQWSACYAYAIWGLPRFLFRCGKPLRLDFWELFVTLHFFFTFWWIDHGWENSFLAGFDFTIWFWREKWVEKCEPTSHWEISISCGRFTSYAVLPVLLLQTEPSFSEAATWFGLWFLIECFRRCLQLVFHIQCFSDTFYPFVADRRATARTTETLSHAASSQKKTSHWEISHWDVFFSFVNGRSYWRVYSIIISLV